jgi:hypothetical protein
MTRRDPASWPLPSSRNSYYEGGSNGLNGGRQQTYGGRALNDAGERGGPGSAGPQSSDEQGAAHGSMGGASGESHVQARLLPACLTHAVLSRVAASRS